MLGRKKKAADAPKSAWADSYDGAEIEAALRGEWLTLALAQFESGFTTSFEPHRLDPPIARGVVHFNIGFRRLIPAQLTLHQEEPVDRARVGRARFNYFNALADEPAHVVLEVAVNDPRGKIAAALHDAFLSAAASQLRFVHVSFRRQEPDAEAILGELRERKYGGGHDLSDISFTRKVSVPSAPAWAWKWHRDD